MQRYLVGGAVRDRLLGLPCKDRDWVVVGVTADQLVARGYQRVGKSFPVFLHPETKEEHTLACRKRGDLSTAGAEVRIEDDLKGRDLTINAIAETAAGELIDPLGGGRDLEDRVLRPVSADSFLQDPLRVLRVARFAAELASLGFDLAVETQKAMSRLSVVEGLYELAGERVGYETEKARASAAPARFIETLRSAGVLRAVFPEIARLFGVPQPKRWHPEIDTGVHVLKVLTCAAALSPRVDVRFAALTHDLGKGTTPADLLPSHRGHEERGAELLVRLVRRIRVPTKIADLARITALWHGHVHRATELRAATTVKVLERTDAVRRPERFARFLLACEADFRGRTGFEDRRYPQRAFFQQALDAVTGIDSAAIANSETSEKIQNALHQARVRAVADLPKPDAA